MVVGIVSNYIKKHHLSLISIFIGLLSLGGVINLSISNYLHKAKIEKLNNSNHLFDLKYYDNLSKIIKKHNLSKPFPNTEIRQMFFNLQLGCNYLTTDDVKNDKPNEDFVCVGIANNIGYMLVHLDSESKRKRVLQDIDKLKNRVHYLMLNNK